MKRFYMMVIVLMAMLFSTKICLAQDDINWDEIFYGDGLQPIVQFVDISVAFTDDEAAQAVGLDADELSTYARFRFKNNFANIPYQESYDYVNFTEGDGYLSINVWVVGDDYPVVYYIDIEMGSYEYYDTYDNAILGYCDSTNINDEAKDRIDELIEDCAMIFFSARNEI